MKKAHTTKTAWLFPGQGSQFIGMGEHLFDKYQDLTSQASQVLGYSVSELCLRDPDNVLNNTQFTQPAIYTVNTLAAMDKMENEEEQADYLAGHSLGEYSALCIAGAFDFLTGLKIVKKRGELMGSVRNGGMAAVIESGERVEFLIKDNGIDELDVANYNAPSQTIVSGTLEAISQLKYVCDKSKITLIPLNVSGAFHSRYMNQVKADFGKYLASVDFSELKKPVIANVNARPYADNSLADNLLNQLDGSVQWVDSVRYLMGQGISSFNEMGSKKVLTRMVDQILAECQPIFQPELQPLSLSPSMAISAPSELTLNSTPEVIPPLNKVNLGSQAFIDEYQLKHAYVVGAMANGIASVEVVTRAAKAGLMSFFGAGGVALPDVEKAIVALKKELSAGESFGINFLHQPDHPDKEEALVDLLLQQDIRCIEASAFMQVTPALVRYRLAGIYQDIDGHVKSRHRVFAKLSRPEVARAFLVSPPTVLLEKLKKAGHITDEVALLAAKLPMADEIVVECDSGGHTDMGIMQVLLPAILQLRDELMQKQGHSHLIRVGAGGGIGSPQAVAAAFTLGADFIVTGSINQCTIEAGTSPVIKDILQTLEVQDTAYAPAGDMFEIGAKVQVVRKGIFFPSRANKLYDLYRQYPSLEHIEQKTRLQLQDRFFQRSFEAVYREVEAYYSAKSPEQLKKAERDPRHKMALTFRWYFAHSSRVARAGDLAHKTDFQIHCGPSMGTFNQWLKTTGSTDWQSRHVDELAEQLMLAGADYLQKQFTRMFR